MIEMLFEFNDNNLDEHDLNFSNFEKKVRLFWTTNGLSCDNFEKQNENKSNYILRKAMRSVVFNDKNEIAIIFVKKHGYYKLPGGGVDKNETYENCLNREILEETGCSIKIFDCLGSILEHRINLNFIQISYAYVSKVLSIKDTNFTSKEISEGFDLKWTTISKAIELVRSSQTNDYSSKFICRRDLIFLLKTAEKNILK